jgi:hypothetical protein
VSAPHLCIPVGVVIERVRAESPWTEFIWRPLQVLPGLPEAAPWTELEANAERACIYAGVAEIALHASTTAHYLSNLQSGAPALWVVLRPTALEPPYSLVAVTADPTEGESYVAAGDNLADAAPGARDNRALRCRAPCRATVLQAQARPRRSGRHGAACAGPQRAQSMSESDSFLTRWSRRKRMAEATPPASAETKPTPAAPHESEARAPSGEPASARHAATDGRTPVEPRVDLSRLPALDSITASTDIRAFLAPGVPLDLQRAALRKAWSADPAIRDYIGLSENAFDFNAGEGLAGFGPIEMTEELRRLVARIVGEAAEEVPQADPQPVGQEAAMPRATKEAAAPPVPSPRISQDARLAAAAPAPRAPEPSVPSLPFARQYAPVTNAAAHARDSAAPQQKAAGRRRHGGALPQ